jgi:hypothetical protein
VKQILFCTLTELGKVRHIVCLSSPLNPNVTSLESRTVVYCSVVAESEHAPTSFSKPLTGKYVNVQP